MECFKKGCGREVTATDMTETNKLNEFLAERAQKPIRGVFCEIHREEKMVASDRIEKKRRKREEAETATAKSVCMKVHDDLTGDRLPSATQVAYIFNVEANLIEGLASTPFLNKDMNTSTKETLYFEKQSVLNLMRMVCLEAPELDFLPSWILNGLRRSRRRVRMISLYLRDC